MTTKQVGSDFDDLQDILAGLLDDPPPSDEGEETPPDIQAEEDMESEAYQAAQDADSTEEVGEPEPEEDDDLAALQRIMDDEPEPPPKVAKPVAKQMAAAAPAAAVKDDDPEDFLRGLMEEAQGGGVATAEVELNGTAAEVSVELHGTPAPQGPQVHIPVFTTDEIADAIDIRNFGTLVTLQTRRWHAKVKDRQASKDAASVSGADSEAFDTHKRLLVGADEKLKRIHKAIDQARAKHYDMTLPWSTVSAADSGKRTGARLLPNTLFMEYTTAMAHAKKEMKDALADFLPAYPSLVKIAQQRLGKRFNAAEYPHSTSIVNYFDLSFDFMPIPLGDDFKGLARAQVDRLADTLARKNNEMLENAMQEAWLRLREIVEHAAERLSNPDALFHYTMVDNLREQAKLMKHLNVTGDQRIEDVRFYIEKHLTMHDVADIRKDDALRKALAKHAKHALDMMEEP